MSHRSYWFLVSLLGSLSVISPFAIDTYLPAYPQMAADLGVQTETIALTLSSYFIGLALGQVFYGPLLDRFGRKKPLTVGLTLFVVASLGCAVAPDVYTLIALRFVQALGGCVAQVASITMVGDFFPVKDKARILSRLFLFIAASPLLAPSIGSLMMLAGGWKLVFLFLAVGGFAILTLVRLKLPEGHQPDPSISLRPGPIVAEYWTILRHARFITYTMAGAFSFAGLFTYVAGSPIIFRDGFGLGETAYSVIFAVLAVGFIGGSQLNVVLLKRYDSETLFFRFLMLQVAVGLVFVTATVAGVCGLAETLVLLFCFLSCVGITNPNASALALSPFTKNAGSASALLGFFQLGVGALISTGIGAAKSSDRFPIIAIMSATAVIGLAILLIGRRRALASTAAEPELTEDRVPVAVMH
ncbi:multidrug effflux MFS transporter [Limnoglobus roseus]|uniref:MFS transporter n=1 Tax=Limnoglobus roseus TaxID=2598579 RepID=A0A5C1A9E9_9BACT|nr:multidrug effflux MFS transporter [Limnoglobus roseus]QEL15165.1 MFS transporter [Limnoglobus roseus]